MKRIIAISVCILLVISLLAGCSCTADEKSSPDTNSQSVSSDNMTDNKKDNTTDDNADESFEVVETTPEGAAILRDSEGNTIKINNDGEVESVEDKDGNPVKTDEYIKSHPTVEQKASDIKASGTMSSNSKNSSGSESKSDESIDKSSSGSKSTAGKSDNKNSSQASKSSGSSESKSSKSNSSNSSEKTSSKSDEAVEEEVPSVVVDVPDEDEQETIDFE